MNTFNKKEALDYLINNEQCSDEWSEAGMYYILKKIIQSDDEIFSIEYLDELLYLATNN